MGIIPVMMRKTLLAVTWGILLLFSADHAFAERLSLSFSKLCEAENVNGAGASTADGPTEPETEKAQAKPTRSTEDVALSERLQDLIRFGVAGISRCGMRKARVSLRSS